MVFVILVTAALLLTAGALVWRPAPTRRLPPVHDDTRRVGEDAVLTPHAAARRATDGNAWMIPSGF